MLGASVQDDWHNPWYENNLEANVRTFCSFQPQFVHDSLLRHLEVIEASGFKEIRYELQVFEYFLGYADVLKALKIICRGLTQGEEIQFHF